MHKVALPIIIFLLPNVILANTSTVNEQLKAIETAVESATEQLLEYSEQSEQLKKQLTKNKSELSSLNKRSTDISSELDRITSKKKKTALDLQANKTEHLKLLLYSKARLRALYVANRRSPTVSMLSASNSIEFHKLNFYSHQTRVRDDQILTNLQISSEKLQVAKKELEKLMSDQDQVFQELIKQKKKIEAVLATQAQVIKQINIKQKNTEERLAELQAQSLRLETVLASLTSGADMNYYKTVPQEQPVVNTANSTGKGLKGLEKKLPSPLEDFKVVKNFGKQKINGFAGMVESNGIELSSVNSKVKVIHAGTVAHIGEMPALGKLVIVDHGRRDYSLYAKLERIELRIGQVIEAGEELGQASIASESGRASLYFEIRSSGKAIDPLKFLKQ